MEPNDSRTGQGDAGGRLIPAVILIVIGAVFLLNNLHIWPHIDWWRFWPVVLIALGVGKLVERRPGQGYAGGAILFGLGAALLADNLDLLPIPIWDLWPLALIAIGIGLLLDRLPWGERLRGTGATWGSGKFDPRTANLSAVFSGGKRKFDGEDFRGGTVSTVFGGFEVDLRRAIMSADSAVLQVDAVFGGCEIKVPETWNVTLRGGAVFGGYSDETHHPAVGTPGMKHLLIKGGAVFGGVVIKN